MALNNFTKDCIKFLKSSSQLNTVSPILYLDYCMFGSQSADFKLIFILASVQFEQSLSGFSIPNSASTLYADKMTFEVIMQVINRTIKLDKIEDTAH